MINLLFLRIIKRSSVILIDSFCEHWGLIPTIAYPTYKMHVWEALTCQHISFSVRYVGYVDMYQWLRHAHHYTVSLAFVLCFSFSICFSYFLRIGKYTLRALCDYIYNASLSSIYMLADADPIEFSECYIVEHMLACWRRISKWRMHVATQFHCCFCLFLA